MNKFFIAILFFLCVGLGFGQNPKPETLVMISTDYGEILIKLYNETPRHRDNFIKLAKEGYFNSSAFHRVIKYFMIQGGGKDNGYGDVDYTLPAEIIPGLYHKKGALAAARQPDNINPKKESSGSQFYLVHGHKFKLEDLKAMETQMNKVFSAEQIELYTTQGGAPHLDNDYTIFGEVIMGFEVVDQIARVEIGKYDKPLKDIKMTVTILE
ncbi:MAG: peptidylprolyl isomerase [Bacteroidales bacterium]|nr:peptidylprolyl isomerase [Bacteroidales bacterium]